MHDEQANRDFYTSLIERLTGLVHLLLVAVVAGGVVCSVLGVVIIVQLRVPPATVLQEIREQRGELKEVASRVETLENVTIGEWRQRLKDANPHVQVPES